MIDVVTKSPDGFGLLRAVDHWRDAMYGYGPGVIDLKLDALIGSPAEVSSMMEILHRARDELAAFGTKIPAATLNARNIVTGIQFYDYPVGYTLSAVDELKRLMLG